MSRGLSPGELHSTSFYPHSVPSGQEEAPAASGVEMDVSVTTNALVLGVEDRFNDEDEEMNDNDFTLVRMNDQTVSPVRWRQISQGASKLIIAFSINVKSWKNRMIDTHGMRSISESS
jgi:hypothetical protein